MDWNTIDWVALEELRTAFLSGTAGMQDYWRSEKQIASYDATFAQRIGWKWDYVLLELQRRGWKPPGGELLDWGCGSGIASRAFLDLFGVETASSLRLWDRSALAMQFAAKRAREKYPKLRAEMGKSEAPSILLVSHVLTELTQPQVEELVTLATAATSVLWVEPGTFEASYTLVAVREKLREHFNVVAPCTHQNRCGMLTPENERHWCHHFASPPGDVFVDGNWSRFAKMTGVDLRDLPLSFLVMDKRPVVTLPEGAARVIGHPRVYKPHALLLGCDAAGVRERKLTKRALPEEFKRLRKGECDPLQVWQESEGEISRVSSL